MNRLNALLLWFLFADECLCKICMSGFETKKSKNFVFFLFGFQIKENVVAGFTL